MMLLDLDRADCLHLAVALDLHCRTLRDQHGVPLPEALEQLRAHAWTAAKDDKLVDGRQYLVALLAGRDG